MNPTMTLKEVTGAMREAGVRTSETTIANGIENGRYPFGSIVSIGKTGRRRVEIFRSDFERWLKEEVLR